MKGDQGSEALATSAASNPTPSTIMTLPTCNCSAAQGFFSASGQMSRAL